jgi:uncharacterized protein (DUF3084 family)
MAQNRQEPRTEAMKGVVDAMRDTRELQRDVSRLDTELESLSRQKQYLEGKRGSGSLGLDDGIAQIDARIEELTVSRAEQAEALTTAQSGREASEARLDRVVKNIDDAGTADDVA